ncbi:60S acidic ribosomal protein P2B [Capsicum chinense]|nr:60S acidic ribosomal protein P2B [Capsicum chinense]
MKVIAAYLLAVLGGNTNPTDKDLKKILASGGHGFKPWKQPLAEMQVGAEGEDDRIQLLLSEVKGKDITELIAAGREKLASVPSGGGAVAVAASAGGGAAAPTAEEKKEEKKAEEKEESDDDMGFSLFD